MGQNGVLGSLMTAAFGVVLGVSAAHAQGRIAQSGWEGFVMPGSDSRFERCVLYNRAISALNDSPYDMLGLSRERSGAVGMLVFYRPRMLKRGTGIQVRLKFDRTKPFVVKGEVRSDFHVSVAGPLDVKVVEALRRAKTLAVTTQGLTGRFALADVGAVLDALDSCVKKNTQQE